MKKLVLSFGKSVLWSNLAFGNIFLGINISWNKFSGTKVLIKNLLIGANVLEYVYFMEQIVVLIIFWVDTCFHYYKPTFCAFVIRLLFPPI